MQGFEFYISSNVLGGNNFVYFFKTFISAACIYFSSFLLNHFLFVSLTCIQECEDSYCSVNFHAGIIFINTVELGYYGLGCYVNSGVALFSHKSSQTDIFNITKIPGFNVTKYLSLIHI